MQLDLNPQFKHALKLMEETSQNLFITGKAGTGKSTLLEYFCRHTAKKPVVLAPTGVAALNVHGQTIHHFFHFYIDVTTEKIRSKRTKPRNAKLYKNLKTIIIDEASMLRADLLDCVDVFLRKYGPERYQPFGGVQMIFVGDLYQLSPVVRRSESQIFSAYYTTPYFFSAKALEKTALEIVELEKVYRQKDEKFIHLLNKIRTDLVEPEDIKELNQRYFPDAGELTEKAFVITLTSTNAVADEINDRHLNALSGQLHSQEAKISGTFEKDYYPTAINLQFKVGAQIMLLNNDPGNRWVNGTIAVIKKVKQDKEGGKHLQIKLQDNNELVTLFLHTWEVYEFSFVNGAIAAKLAGSFTQYPFRLAWAVTIHKSQGKTFDRVIIDIGWGTFASGQVYVALSRCTSFEGIKLKVPIREKHIQTDPRIAKFLTSHACQKPSEKRLFDDKLATIEGAIQAGKKLKMIYRKANNTKISLVIAPIMVIEMACQQRKFPGMLAYCSKSNEEHIFNVARILDLKEIKPLQ